MDRGVEIENLQSNSIAEQVLLKEIRSQLSAVQLRSRLIEKRFGKAAKKCEQA